eukprot:485806-Pyramimonas_sp.AAC.1
MRVELINHLLVVKRFTIVCSRTGASLPAELTDLTIKDGKAATLFIRGQCNGTCTATVPHACTATVPHACTATVPHA